MLSILLCALRDIAYDNKFDSLAEEIQDTCLKSRHKKGLEGYRIVPRFIDREILHDLIDGNDIPDKGNISMCYKFFKRKIKLYIRGIDKNEIRDEENSKLKVLFNVIARRLSLVWIIIDKQDDPWSIFDSLNGTALKLEEADFIRNHIFRHVYSEQEEEFYTIVWSPFEKKFIKAGSEVPDSSLTTKFYRDFLICRTGDYVGKEKIYANFVEFYRSINKQGIDLTTFVNEMKYYADIYFIVNGEAESHIPQIDKAFSRINSLEVNTANPLLMSIYARFLEGDITASECVKMLKAIESFVVRRNIMRARTRGYGFQFADAVRNSQTLDDLILFLLDIGWHSDAKIREELKTFEFYKHIRPNPRRMILRELENSFNHKEPVLLTESITVEHVMPQTLTREWEEMLGDRYDQYHSQYKDTLGNLTLTGYNSELGNLPFYAKKQRFLESHFELNRHFQRVEKWTISEILERGELLANRIIELWAHPDSGFFD